MTGKFQRNLTASAELNARVIAALEIRGLSEQERSNVNTLQKNLFPIGFELDVEGTEEFRALCATSQVTLIRPTLISSHRKLLGPAIVAIKRLLWPIAQIYLKQTLILMSEFNSRTVIQLARTHVRATHVSAVKPR